MTDDRQDIAAAAARAAQLLRDGFEPTQEELDQARMLKEGVDAFGREQSVRDIAAMLRAIREMGGADQGSA